MAESKESMYPGRRVEKKSKRCRFAKFFFFFGGGDHGGIQNGEIKQCYFLLFICCLFVCLLVLHVGRCTPIPTIGALWEAKKLFPNHVMSICWKVLVYTGYNLVTPIDVKQKSTQTAGGTCFGLKFRTSKAPALK